MEFERRKQDHIRLSMDEVSQASSRTPWDQYQLSHEAFPEMNFEEVDLSTSFFSSPLSVPFFISSMTAGHSDGVVINERLAGLSAHKKILMGVGSQRRELMDPDAQKEWKLIRQKHPQALLMGNVGLTQVITHAPQDILKLVDSLQPLALQVHTNPLQEALQFEGTPQFRGGYQALENLIKKSPVPVIVKEVGNGFSTATLHRLKNIGVSAVDISGKTGTHWGRIEGLRSQNTVVEKASRNFSEWGYFCLDTLIQAQADQVQIPLWASGGVRSGVDVAKALACGAQMVGLAQPWLKAALESEAALDLVFQQLKLELKVSLFCTGSKKLSEIKGKYGHGNQRP